MSAGRLASQAACSSSGVPQYSSRSHHGTSSCSDGSAEAAAGDAGQPSPCPSPAANSQLGGSSSSSSQSSLTCPITSSPHHLSSHIVSGAADLPGARCVPVAFGGATPPGGQLTCPVRRA